MAEKGFIKLSRKFFSHRMWEAARTFSECEAWLDLIQSARFEATVKIECIGGREIKYGRGQYPASNRFLAKRWDWGEQKVKSFLTKLKKDGMITTDKSQGMNVITLCKYDEYNSNNPSNNPTNNPDILLYIKDLQDKITQLTTQLATQHQPSSNPNSKKEEESKRKKEDKESSYEDKKAAAKAATQKRRDEFWLSISEFSEKYPSAMIKNFFDYWSEMDRSCRKMRFEKQATWEVSKRLATWANKEKFNPNQSSHPAVENLKNKTYEQF